MTTQEGEKLTPLRVQEIFLDCLFRDGEDASTAVMVEGITTRFGLHPDRIESHRDDVKTLLAQLPETFHAEAGGGWSFLNACTNRDGELWTGEHRIMEQLFVLGMALGLVECQLPREMWSVLPGGMPYYVVLA